MEGDGDNLEAKAKSSTPGSARGHPPEEKMEDGGDSKPEGDTHSDN